MELGLRGKAAVVLGASEGIGRAVADRLAEEGADLVVSARREDVLREAAAEIAKRHGVRVHPVVADAMELRDLERVFDAASMEYSRLDVLVTNHGGPPHGRLFDLDDADWASGFELIVGSVVRATRLAVPLFGPRGGSIVHVVSSAARQPVDNILLSNTLRPAVCGFSKSVAGELAPRRIRSNCVLPGLTDTARLRALDLARAEEEGIAPEEVRRRRLNAVPLARAARPDEIADAVAFLASERSSYVTGQAWTVDGGLVRSVF